MTVTVLAPGAEESVRLEWASSTTLLEGASIPPGFDEILSEVPRERIVYTLTDDGTFGRVDNVDEIRASMDQAISLLEETGVIGSDSGRLRDIYAGLSDEAFAQLFSERPTIFHALDGIELAVDSLITFDDLLPNAFGDEPFPATTTVSITDLVDPDGCVEITMSVVPDPEDLLRILGPSLVDAGFIDDLAEFEPNVLGIEIENTVVAQYDAGTGRAWRVYASQLIEIAGERRLDETTISDVTAG